MVGDLRYVILAGILIMTILLIKRFPEWEKAIAIGLAATGLCYALLFGLPND